MDPRVTYFESRAGAPRGFAFIEGEVFQAKQKEP